MSDQNWFLVASKIFDSCASLKEYYYQQYGSPYYWSDDEMEIFLLNGDIQIHTILEHHKIDNAKYGICEDLANIQTNFMLDYALRYNMLPSFQKENIKVFFTKQIEQYLKIHFAGQLA